ncbi:MAG: autotransporter outer membrane beta-barrel domain-containing protein [Parasphingorhabdus sp.]|uniref:autotransporter outer membrane beta-barrel domain-containing protein n=1 Tax=Parasphingorhabdus sp. TaxID=2709688 RepID=UPI003299E42D
MTALRFSVSAAAIGAALLFGIGAMGARPATAGTCSEIVVGTGDFTCSGPAEPAADVTQFLSVVGPVTVTTENEFGITTMADQAIAINGIGGTIFEDLAMSTINGQSVGIRIENSGADSLSLFSNGVVTGLSEDGIFALNGAGAQNLTVLANITNGETNGIIANNLGLGALTVTSTGFSSGADTNGIYALNNIYGTDLVVNAVDTFGGASGIAAFNLGSGALSVSSTGLAEGESSYGIVAENSISGSSLSITAVDAIGGTVGIRANNEGTAGLSISVTGDVIGERADGIYAINSANAVAGSMDIDQQANTTITGANNGITASNYGAGALTISVQGTVVGQSYNGINARTGNAATDLTIDSNIVTGAENGIYARNYGSGALSISSTGTVTGASFDGIYAFNSFDSTDLTIGSVFTTGAEYGIYAANVGTGALTISATGQTEGENYAGIFALNSGFSTSLSVDVADVVGGTYGLNIFNFGSAGVAISVGGDVQGESQAGIAAFNSVNDVSGSMVIMQDVSSTITGATSGIMVQNYGGSLTINALGTVIGENGNGIDGFNGMETTDFSITSNIAQGSLHGISADHEGSGVLTINSTGSATGITGSGIVAANTANGTSLNISAVDSSGNIDGIDAVNTGSGALMITATGSVSGELNDGIDALNSVNGTDLTITAFDTDGEDHGINAINNGTGALSIVSTGLASGGTNRGIYAFNSNNGTSVSILSANVIGGIIGIEARNFGSAGLAISISGDVTGQSQSGILAYNSANDISASMTIDQEVGSTIIGATSGIDAENFGGSLTINALGTVIGNDGNGINVVNQAGTSNLSIVSNVAQGSDQAIYARQEGSGALTITSTELAVGTEGSAIFAESSVNGTNMAITVMDILGAVDGISVSHAGDEAVAITSNGVVAGGTGNAITAITTGSVIMIDNNGTLESGVGFALAASGGGTQLTNAGTVNGRVQLSDFDDVAINNGLFNATLDSDFGAAVDLFTNNATLRVQGAISLIGLEQLTNDGLITTANDMVGDSLTTTGNYSGTGEFEFDVSFDNLGTADTLIISGAATGNTLFAVNDVSTSAVFGNRVLVVDAGVGTNADAFALDEPGATIGFFAYSVLYEEADNDFYLVNTIGTPVFQTLKFAEGAQSLWYRSADAWAAHFATPNPQWESPAWIQIYGNITNQDDSFSFGIAEGDEPIAVNYEQDYFGLQLGYEFGAGAGAGGDGAVYGVTAGYLNSNLGFRATADNVRYDALNIGLYAGIRNGRFFANALAKYDFIQADVRARTAGYTADLDGAAYGVRIEAGYRIGADSFFVRPLVSFEYQQTKLDDFSALGADISYDNFDGLRGMAGFRLGGETAISRGSQLTYYAGGQAVHQSQLGDGITFTSGDTLIEIENRLSRTFGRFELGLSIATVGGVTGFIEGNADMGGDYTGFGGRGGLKVQF